MKKICPKCKGEGKHKPLLDYEDKFAAIVTFGFSLVLKENVECKVCEGKGYIEE